MCHLIERRGHYTYSTAALLNQQGHIASRYRKLHLTTSELEAGIVPGDAAAVVATDFARVGLLICDDMQFPQATQLTAVAGAEIICAPTVGDRWPERRDAVTRAHALANGVFVVTSLVHHPSDIGDPEGRLLATASEPNSVATAHADLAYKQRAAGRAQGPAAGLHPEVYRTEQRPDMYAVPHRVTQTE